MDQPHRQDLLILGRAIREVREEHRLSVAELAAGAGLTSARLATLEAGRFDPGFELLLALADALGVRPSRFFIRAEELARRDGAEDI